MGVSLQLQISPTHHVENWVTALEFMNTEWLRSWRVKNSKVWDMDPTVVNAYNIFERNAISKLSMRWSVLFKTCNVLNFPQISQ